MSERDELARIIASQHTNAAVEEIIKAGYRKPLTIENDKLVIDDGLLLLEVGECTCSPYGSSHELGCGYEYLDDLTKPLERAGYRKLRTVRTAEEVRNLPALSVVIHDDMATGGPLQAFIVPDDGTVMFKDREEFHLLNFNGDYIDAKDMPLPLTVVYEVGNP